MLPCMLGIVALAISATAGSTDSSTLPIQEPEQVHVAFGSTPDYVIMHWTTMEPVPATGSHVRYTTDQTQPFSTWQSNEGSSFQFRDFGDELRNYTMHVAKAVNLTASARYWYCVGDDLNGWSPVFSFKTMPDAQSLEKSLPLVFGVFGDQGDQNGQTITHLQQEAAQHSLDMILHVGDMAYNLDSDNGRNGDAWMRDIEPYAATVPYMVSMGNHESARNFNHYTMRFRNMPSNSGTLNMTALSGYGGQVPNNWYYSFNIGPVHIVAISTEIYFDFPDMIEQQYQWVEADLKAANANRSQAPWIIVHGHKPLYCSCDGDCDSAATLMRMGVQNKTTGKYEFGMEQLFYNYGVDFYICGHEHNYERMYDVAPDFNEKQPWLSGKTTKSTTNPPATTYIVTGSAGNTENHEPFTRPSPARDAFRSNTYGYSRMTVYNATHVLWQQKMCDNGQPPEDEGKIIDEVWIVQENHGPFTSHPRRLAPAIASSSFEHSKCHDNDVVSSNISRLSFHLHDENLMDRHGRWQFSAKLARP